jgi:1-deoxy-D-xylulose-5-phosphate synthase
MQRAYDQVVHDVALQNLHVIFCMDRAGLAGADGQTHHGMLDIPYMRCVPNMVVSAPMNEEELRNLMYTATLDKNAGPFSIRYPRGNGVLIDWKRPFAEIEVGKGRKLKDGKDMAILSFGTAGLLAQTAINLLEKDGISCGHYDMRFVKPLDEELLHEIFAQYKYIITVEDGTIVGGFGSAILEFMAENHYSADLTRMGMPDRIVEHGEPNELYAECGYDAKAIQQKAKSVLGIRNMVH